MNGQELFDAMYEERITREQLEEFHGRLIRALAEWEPAFGYFSRYKEEAEVGSLDGYNWMELRGQCWFLWELVPEDMRQNV